MKTITVMRDGRPATDYELQCAVEGKPLPPVSCSAALLEIIKTCEDYQNADTEGMELERQCDDGYRAICKVITIASGMLAQLEAQQNMEM